MQNRLPELAKAHYPLIRSKGLEMVVLAKTLAGQAKSCLQNIPHTRSVLVADDNTYAALGKRIAQELALPSERVLILEKPVADEETVTRIQNHSSADLLIAVGSGTLNDLTKLASHRLGIPYIIFPTAASMNGYASANASLHQSGISQSIATHLPVAIFCDLEIIANAPARLTRAGFGDAICRPTAQADWLLSHLLLGTNYSDAPFELLKPYEKELHAQPENIELLMNVLLLGGFGMVLAGGSYPASQGEHMIAHAMEKLFPGKAFHGEQIAVTTLTMASRQEQILSRTESPKLLPQENKIKLELIKQARVQDWSSIRNRIQAVTVPSTKLRESLLKVGCPITPESIGWSQTAYDKTVESARHSRDRFTFLDVI